MGCGRRASGLGQAANEVGKILGPLSLAVIAGTSNVLKPAATGAAVFPTFMFLAFWELVIALPSPFSDTRRTAERPQDADATQPRLRGHRTERHSPIARRSMLSLVCASCRLEDSEEAPGRMVGDLDRPELRCSRGSSEADQGASFPARSFRERPYLLDWIAAEPVISFLSRKVRVSAKRVHIWQCESNSVAENLM